MKTRTIEVSNPKLNTIRNLLNKVRNEAPNNPEMVITFNAPELPMRWEMVIWYGFIWKDETPSDNPVWFYAFKGTSQTKIFNKETSWHIFNAIDTYAKLGAIEKVTVEYEDWDDSENNTEE